jgi:hypothetical protein
VIVQSGHHQVVLHQVVHHLAHQEAARNLVRIDLRELVAQIEPVPPDMFLRAVKSVIHAGFVLHRKNEINHELDLASLNQIFQKMLQVKNLKRAYAQSY